MYPLSPLQLKSQLYPLSPTIKKSTCKFPPKLIHWTTEQNVVVTKIFSFARGAPKTIKYLSVQEIKLFLISPIDFIIGCRNHIKCAEKYFICMYLLWDVMNQFYGSNQIISKNLFQIFLTLFIITQSTLNMMIYQCLFLVILGIN